ncbi:MAG: hypothetical protein JW741_05550 [Sedimentisphaerales bacterium]|nr:hypothetical protein [Sedimentisphaerales bacterium]
MANQKARTITARTVLAVEGEDDRNFFDRLLRHIDLADVQIEAVGGKNQFPEKLPALLRAPGFFEADGSSRVTNLALVRDKDQDNAFESIANIVRRVGLTPPGEHGVFSDGRPRVGIFVMPGETIDGTMLEDLCLKTVEGHEAMRCVEQFASCVGDLPSAPKNMAKAKAQVFRAQVFLAAQTDTVDALGLAAQKGYWDFDSPALAELKGFLEHLR